MAYRERRAQRGQGGHQGSEVHLAWVFLGPRGNKVYQVKPAPRAREAPESPEPRGSLGHWGCPVCPACLARTELQDRRGSQAALVQEAWKALLASASRGKKATTAREESEA